MGSLSASGASIAKVESACRVILFYVGSCRGVSSKVWSIDRPRTIGCGWSLPTPTYTRIRIHTRTHRVADGVGLSPEARDELPFRHFGLERLDLRVGRLERLAERLVKFGVRRWCQ